MDKSTKNTSGLKKISNEQKGARNSHEDTAKVSRRILLFWCLFIGIGAVWGSLCMFIDPSGKTFHYDMFFEGFKKLPFYDILFQNLIFPGIALLIVNGISNITAAILILKKKKIGVVLGTIFGITLMLWITIQFIIFPANILSTSYFIFGLLQFITGYICFVRTTQDHYIVDIKDYPGIRKKADILVVYFSRMGYTKMLAYETANKYNAEILELRTKERTKGVLGFWWCGRFGMHGWPMVLEPNSKKLYQYKKVIICTPVWVFGIAAPVKEFLKYASGKINNVQYIINHFNPMSYKRLVDEMNQMVGIQAAEAYSVTTQIGKRKKIKKL